MGPGPRDPDRHRPVNDRVALPDELNLLGDAQSTLAAIIPLLEHKPDRTWRHQVEANVADWWDLTEARAFADADPINPQRIFWELSPRLPDDVIICGDSGSSTQWLARDVRVRAGMRMSTSGTLATMGSAVPYAISAKFAHPDQPVLAVAGDGAMQMNGNAELLTVAKYWQRWANPCFVVMVLHNNDLNMVTWEQRAMNGDPKFDPSQDLPDFNYARYAELCGLHGIRVEHPDGIADAWDQAFSATVPTVIDILASPDVPAIPPHLQWDQATSLISALLKGDPDTADIIHQGAKQGVLGFLTRHRRHEHRPH